jgi:hypothetical protein
MNNLVQHGLIPFDQFQDAIEMPELPRVEVIEDDGQLPLFTNNKRKSAEQQPFLGGTTNLLPCPLCGESATFASMPGTSEWWQVRCDNYYCGCKTWAMHDAEKAITAWNRRANGKA